MTAVEGLNVLAEVGYFEPLTLARFAVVSLPITQYYFLNTRTEKGLL